MMPDRTEGAGAWLETRLPLRRLAAALLAERIPGGARWAYVFGSICLTLLAVQFVTGVAIALFYVPAPNAALASIAYLSTQVACGRLVLGIHHWSANIFVGVILLHVAQTFLYGAYKQPRELVWLSGVVLLLLVQGFHFTGFVLPWDQKGYWATEVATSIMRTTPLVGELVLRVVRGGEELGALTLSHFYAVHVLVLPAAVVLFAVLHVAALRWAGPAGSWRPSTGASEDKRFFPDQVFKDAVAVTLVVVVIVALAAFDYAPPAYVADPTDTSVVPRPEWNFLFLFQIQRYFPGAVEWVATMVAPGVLVGFLLAVPFIDRRDERHPSRRLGVIVVGAAIAVSIAALTVLAIASDPATWAYVTRPQVRAGAQLYAENDCASCHRIRGDGVGSGPDLSFIGQTRDRNWLRTYVRDPDSLNPSAAMPPQKGLSGDELDAIAVYLESLR